MRQKNIFFSIFVASFFFGRIVFANSVYQDFEPDNGTPAKASSRPGDPPEYGWVFTGAFARVSKTAEPVHSGVHSWQVTIPTGEHVIAGSGISAQQHAFNRNFWPECYDRLSFWIWSDPSVVGDHTVMIKFFDHGKYHSDGIGIWTTGKAAYKQWSQLDILYSQLPADFDLAHVDKIEFFHYWAGTYYLDDFELRSAGSGHSEKCQENQGSGIEELEGKDDQLSVDFLKERNFRRRSALDAKRL